MFHWYSMPKFSQKYPVVLEKKLILLILLFLVMAAIMHILPDPLLQPAIAAMHGQHTWSDLVIRTASLRFGN